MTEHAIKSMIHSSLVIKALTEQGIPLGGALTVNTGEQNDGTLSWDFDAPDANEVLSALTGIALAHHVTETMVMPSNADRLDGLRDFLKMFVDQPNVSRGAFTHEDLVERFEELLYDVESVQANLRPDPRK